MNNFQTWFEAQQGSGLVDIKFAVMAGKGVTSTAIKNELLAAEAVISAGYVKKTPPYPTSVIPTEVLKVIEAAHL
ncbi:MAG: hypothetical protein PHD65_02410 [Gallionella sp.]|nr:hypothetical protein [Gallionella sp.]